jgi:hypothetical protein
LSNVGEAAGAFEEAAEAAAAAAAAAAAVAAEFHRPAQLLPAQFKIQGH